MSIFNPGVPQPPASEDAARNARQQAELIEMTRQAARQGAQLAVWPEETLNYDVRTNRGAWIGQLAKETNFDHRHRFPDRLAQRHVAQHGGGFRSGRQPAGVHVQGVPGDRGR